MFPGEKPKTSPPFPSSLELWGNLEDGTIVNVTVADILASSGASGFTILTGLGDESKDYALFQEALNDSASIGYGVYIPPNEHLKLTDVPVFPDNSILVNDGIYENITTVESYPFQGSCFMLGRIVQSDFWPGPNNLGVVLTATGNKITFSSVTNGDWFQGYNDKSGTKESRVFRVRAGVEANPASSFAYISEAGYDGSNYYIELKDSEDSNINADVLAGDAIYVMDTIGVSAGFFNQEGVNAFPLNPTRRGKVVRLSVSGAGSNFEVGEKVIVASKGQYISRFLSDRAFTPYYSHPDYIEAKSGDTITLSIGVHDLGVELSDLQLLKFTSLRNVPGTAHPNGAVSPYAVRNVFIGGSGKFIQNRSQSAIAYAGGCMIDCMFDINELIGGGFTTNGFARSKARIKKLNSSNAAVSIALGSCDFSVEVDECNLTKAPGEGSSKTSRSIVFPHENIVNGSIKFNSPIKVANDYPLAVNVLEMDCLRLNIEVPFEIDKNDQGETPSFGNCIQVRSQQPQLLGDSRGYHGANKVKVVGSSPYVAQVIGFQDSDENYHEQPSDYDVIFTGAFGEGLVIGQNRNNNNINFKFDRQRRVLSVSDLESITRVINPETGETQNFTTVTFSSGDTRVFADGQRVKFSGIVPASWSDLNSNTYEISRIVSDTQIEIDFDSDAFPNYSGSGSPIMEGAESSVFVRDNFTSYLNSASGYCINGVDLTVSGEVWSLSGANRFDLDDAKSRVFRGLASIRALANAGNISTAGVFAARPDNGYQMVTAGIELSGAANPRYPSLFRAGYFDFVQLSSTNSLLSTPNTNLKVGDTFVKTIRGRIYGSHTGRKTIIDTYRWNEGSVPANRGFQTFSFDTDITGGNGFEMRTYLRFSASNYIVAWAVFNDGTEQKISETRFVVTTLLGDFRNHLIAYFNPDVGDPSFPVSPYNSSAHIIAYEETFEGESVTGNTRERIQIESVEFGYDRH